MEHFEFVFGQTEWRLSPGFLGWGLREPCITRMRNGWQISRKRQKVNHSSDLEEDRKE
jgi:hypothetical protein